MPNYLDKFKMASCHMKRDGFVIPSLIKTYLCGTKNGKEICYWILDCREVLKVTIMITWTVRAWRLNSRIWSQLKLKLTLNWLKFISWGAFDLICIRFLIFCAWYLYALSDNFHLSLRMANCPKRSLLAGWEDTLSYWTRCFSTAV